MCGAGLRKDSDKDDESAALRTVGPGLAQWPPYGRHRDVPDDRPTPPAPPLLLLLPLIHLPTIPRRGRARSFHGRGGGGGGGSQRLRRLLHLHLRCCCCCAEPLRRCVQRGRFSVWSSPRPRARAERARCGEARRAAVDRAHHLIALVPPARAAGFSSASDPHAGLPKRSRGGARDDCCAHTLGNAHAHSPRTHTQPPSRRCCTPPHSPRRHPRWRRRRAASQRAPRPSSRSAAPPTSHAASAPRR